MARTLGRSTASRRPLRLSARLLLAGLPAVALAVTMALGSTARAQQSGPSLTVAQVDAAAYPKLNAVVTVLDANGVPVPGLTAAQFHAFDGSTEIPVRAVTSAQDPGLPLDVVLAIDTSGSMAGAPLDRAKQAAVAFVNALGANDSVTLLAFADTVRTPAPAGADHAAVIDAINGLQAGGATALYDAVQGAVYAAVSAQAPRKAVVLLSDGQNDTQASTTGDAALGAVRSGGLPVFTIGFGDQPDAAFLRSLSDATHGQYAGANAANVADVYAAIGTLLRGQYGLALDASAAADGKPATLRIVADAAGGTVEATSQFTRGAAPAVQPVPTTAQAQPTPAQASSGGGSNATVVVIVAIVVAALVALLGFLLVRRMRASRRRQQNEATAGRQSDEPVPAPRAELRDDPTDRTRGRITELNGDGAGRSFEFGTVPLSIGSAARCTVRLAQAPDVAPEHALIWAKGGKLMLRHVGGPRRRTLVASKPVDWVILDDGDEFAIGTHRYRAERLSVSVPGTGSAAM
jgi:VWFA-related protein